MTEELKSEPTHRSEQQRTLAKLIAGKWISQAEGVGL